MSAHGDAMVAAREAIADTDLNARADLLALDLTRLAASCIFTQRKANGDLSPGDLDFAVELHRELERGLRADADMIFLVERPATQSEAREAVAVADEAIERVVIAALAVAESRHRIGMKARDALKAFRVRVRDHDLDSPKVKADRERWINSLPKHCINCGDDL